MGNSKKMKSALISVFDKSGLEDILMLLNEHNVSIYSTGGTQKFIAEKGIEVNAVENLTGYPSILGGRVKTLHPKVFGGILARRENNQDLAQLSEYEIPEFDLVIVDLYPFEKTVASGAEEQDIIEKIDIGGISLIRAAAKNFKDVLVVASQDKYADLASLLKEKKASSDIEDRKNFAAHAFSVSSHYDTAIFNYFNNNEADKLRISVENKRSLRYGENPHQKAHFFGDFNALFDQIHGKEISYNNLLDIDAAVQLISEFNETTCVILKHNNACGLASRNTLAEAWEAALEGDPISAFGGIIITNIEVDKTSAEMMNKLFFEVIIAPSYSEEALSVLKQKKNRIILIQKSSEIYKQGVRSALNGYLVQERDTKIEGTDELKTVTDKSPESELIEDLLFANKIVKHSKSNAIVLAKNKQLLASGIGQTSRVDALKQAIVKAKGFELDLNGGVMASDAFFPFADSVEIASKEGIVSVIQPGGSIRDKDSIEFCNKAGISMVFTGIRHFKH